MKRLFVVAAALALTACAEDQSELRAWMQQVRANTPPVQERIDPPKRFEPFRYDNTAQADPFSADKLAVVFESGQARAGSGLKPDLNRRREVLEDYPLDTIRMVGNLRNGRQNHALLQVDKVVYQARVGNYAGQNFGLITRISETEVLLKELVQDAAGDWVERQSELRLQEGGSQ
ncbi:MAG: pilus assembly protein PilP [Burkholderiales bacterium]|nr:MAG: pilus assembly protein PilP [Burkholderiales bacterium]